MREVIITLAGGSVILMIMEFLMPDGPLKKSVSIVIGVIFLIIMINPLRVLIQDVFKLFKDPLTGVLEIQEQKPAGSEYEDVMEKAYERSLELEGA